MFTGLVSEPNKISNQLYFGGINSIVDQIMLIKIESFRKTSKVGSPVREPCKIILHSF